MQSVTITYLEMHSPKALRPKPCTDPRFSVHEPLVKQWEYNRLLYRLVGSDWQWTDKNPWSEEQWRAYAESEALRTLVAHYDRSVAGYYELKRDPAGAIEIAIFGLVPQFIGRGLGGALLTHALETAWREKPKRVWLHTCNLDHPAALANYQARGMSVYKTETRLAE